MCQLNLYMIPKNIPREKVISVFKKNNFYIREESYYKFDDLSEKYEFYHISSHCDCNSIISRLQEENVNSFEEYKVKKKLEDTDKLSRMKKIKCSKDYKKKARKFKKQKEKLRNRAYRLHDIVSDWTDEEIEWGLEKFLVSEELEKIRSANRFEKLNRLFREIEKEKEYKKAFGRYNEYMDKNKDLFDSIYYNISKYQKEIAEYDFSDFNEGYEQLQNLYRDILKLTNEICVYPFWQNEEQIKIEDRKEVKIEDLSVDDLVFLPYRNILKVVV
ncbi:hypothetical protein SAMN02745163_01304 [Clostridium cavendishii DSM 21758]|uniref:Uncharacterized protein n=1 Tax=Clostridium cavendishii DSM 21758 TaxID=1121302 RepID=A0A1M6GJC7_9CLOT|nr:hypothetical protein [Clostridium cavendishii]SHJ10028.1 hypothetical protein SAMN02745163_01304 [Clostridium cavendishii DSM 21758]